MPGEVYTVKFVDPIYVSGKSKLSKDCTTYTFYQKINDMVACVCVELPLPLHDMANSESDSDRCSETRSILEITDTLQENARRDNTPAAIKSLSGLFKQFKALRHPSEFSYEFLEGLGYGYSISYLNELYGTTLSTLNACELGCDDEILNMLHSSKRIKIINSEDTKNTSYLVAKTLEELVDATSEFFQIWSIDGDDFEPWDNN